MSDEEEAQENENTEGHDGAEEGGGSKKKLFIIIGGVLLLLIGGGAGAYFMGLLDPLLGIEKPAEDAKKDGEHGDAHGEGHGEDGGEHGDEYEDGEHEEGGDDHGAAADDGHGAVDSHGKPIEGGKFVVIPTMIINLNTDDGTPRYLRLSVQLELKSPADHAKVTEAVPKVIDQFQTYLRELRVRDLRGSAGIYRLQMELLWRVNQAAAPAKIKDVLFQEILIQ